MNLAIPPAPARRAARAYAARRALGLIASALWCFPWLTGCDLFEEDSGNEIQSAKYTTSSVIVPSSVTTATASTVNILADVPETSRAMGIVLIGSSKEWKFIEHAGLFLGQGASITGPGGPVPLAFVEILGQPVPFALNNEAAAAHFPNDGRRAKLKAGTYAFPVGAACDHLAATTPCTNPNLDEGLLISEAVSSLVYYKTETAQVPTLKLNVFVVNGVRSSITNDTTAQNDPEIMGAVQVLRNVYQGNASIALNLSIAVQFVNPACHATDAVLESETEQFCLLASFPAPPTHDAMNIFVISSLDYIDPGGAGTGVIGLAAGIPGPFNQQGLAVSGTLAEYQGDGDGTILGFTLAHEFGHFLGLYHTSQTNSSATSVIGRDPIADTKVCKTSALQKSGGINNCPDVENLMFPFVCDCDDPEVTAGQGNVVKYNPGVTLP